MRDIADRARDLQLLELPEHASWPEIEATYQLLCERYGAGCLASYGLLRVQERSHLLAALERAYVRLRADLLGNDGSFGGGGGGHGEEGPHIPLQERLTRTEDMRLPYDESSYETHARDNASFAEGLHSDTSEAHGTESQGMLQARMDHEVYGLTPSWMGWPELGHQQAVSTIPSPGLQEVAVLTHRPVAGTNRTQTLLSSLRGVVSSSRHAQHDTKATQATTSASAMSWEDGPYTGVCLASVREQRGWTVAHVSALTGIRADMLMRIEQSDYRAFASSRELRSFLQVYAEALALDARQVIADYLGGYWAWRTQKGIEH